MNAHFKSHSVEKPPDLVFSYRQHSLSQNETKQGGIMFFIVEHILDMALRHVRGLYS